MRKETETLLRVIGTDKEIGTHGSCPIYLALAHAVMKGEDTQGYLGRISLDKRGYRQAVMEIPAFFNQMTANAFFRLMGFTYYTGFHKDKRIGEKVKAGDISVHEDGGVRKRLLRLETFSELTPPIYDVQELFGEREVKEEYVWNWIGLLGKVDPTAARREMVLKLTSRKNPDYDGFRSHLFSFIYSLNGEAQKMRSLLRAIKGKIPEREFKKIVRDVQLNNELVTA